MARSGPQLPPDGAALAQEYKCPVITKPSRPRHQVRQSVCAHDGPQGGAGRKVIPFRGKKKKPHKRRAVEPGLRQSRPLSRSTGPGARATSADRPRPGLVSAVSFPWTSKETQRGPSLWRVTPCPSFRTSGDPWHPDLVSKRGRSSRGLWALPASPRGARATRAGCWPQSTAPRAVPENRFSRDGKFVHTPGRPFPPRSTQVLRWQLGDA
ncbi:uncharacterized protein LOC119233617 isoform X2 [Talpa occidentalis]|uniref:uncharacterized protein LOC119233617 isoform X2 n=1 Tax=Talpa occidentalis TaxID=50954 RepID=UPI00188FF17D|nr:uncharacterized protein LOC119233617 isoform X2 [Talpa occidentalis]